MQKRILVVDDDAMNLNRTKRILEKTYEVLVADSGSKALDLLLYEEVDLILLDIAMPDMDGLETYKRMKNYSVDIPVIFLTSKDDPESVKKVLELKPDGYLLKYLKPTEIKRRVDEFLRGRKIIV